MCIEYLWKMTVCMKDNTNLEGHCSEGQARRPLNPTDPDLRSAKNGS